jgi:hypothetical protein
MDENAIGGGKMLALKVSDAMVQLTGDSEAIPSSPCHRLHQTAHLQMDEQDDLSGSRRQYDRSSGTSIGSVHRPAAHIIIGQKRQQCEA